MNLIFSIRFSVKYYLLCLSVLLLFSCNRSSGKETQEAMTGNDANEPYKFPVIAMKARKGTLSNYIALNGDIDTKVKTDVFPDATGKITTLNVRLGTYVNKGQVIATLDPSKPGALYLKSPVKAPISGYVLAVNRKIGETVGPQTSIALIGRVDTIQIRAYVSERYILDVKPGNNAVIEIESYPGEKFKAKISEVSPVLDFKSRAAEVYLEPVGNNAKKMVIGMFAKVKIVTNHLKNVIKIPSSAFVEREGKRFVFRVNEDTKTVQMLFPVIDFEVDNIVSVMDGINEDDLIVIEGMSPLSDGAYVNIVEIREGLTSEDNV
ncbi:efflux RND transporter periplasmic adaptor subunit [Borrelia turcica IST7]|uniref:Efflux RND transporter periplasmic adaptor subunit n=1 Tax=Borrelia turcica IST7 TaxID=1104446 RepID=A0A386PMG6_9SPIR|nr:efflux RND transporter periplasmic adaptor subunit [Borrelia turcica]AYE36037.1 efflux RND transporter periplasmic adaptor subunit [Borrelia turcica IST7]